MATLAAHLARERHAENGLLESFSDLAIVVVSPHAIDGVTLRTLFPRGRYIVLVLDEAIEAPESSGLDWLHVVHRNHEGWVTFDRLALRVIRRDISTAVFFSPRQLASGNLMLTLRRIGVRKAIFDPLGETETLSLTRSLWLRVRDRIRWGRAHTKLPAEVAADAAGPFAEWANTPSCAARVNDDSPPNDNPPHIIQYTGSLASGGAERQLAQLAVGLRRCGSRSTVLTTHPPTGRHGHYADLLHAADVPLKHAGTGDMVRLSPLLCSAWLDSDHLEIVPPVLRPAVADLMGELLLEKPEVLHCWLDEPNILGGIAGLLAGVPRIVLSLRNLKPTNFPHFHQPWMRPWYRALAQSDRVIWTANSKAGAEDYADWLDLPINRFQVIHNGVDPDSVRPPAPETVAQFRASLKIGKDQPIIAGIFRLAPEKRPELFVEVIRQVREKIPNAVAVIAGTGPLESTLRAAIANAGLSDAVHLLGRRTDIPTILTAADVVLLTSDYEGTPNCLLEAMALARPVVATGVGGTTAIIRDQITGLLGYPGDASSLTRAVLLTLQDPALAQRMATGGQTLVEQEFTLDGLIGQTLKCYGISETLFSTAPLIETRRASMAVTPPISSTS